MPSDSVLVACNLTPVVCYDYRIGVPALTDYRVLLNAEPHHYGGSIVGGLRAEPVPMHGYGQSIALTLPPLGVVVLEPDHAAIG